MTNYDPQAAGARRFPRVISPDEIDAMLRLKFAPGIDTSIFLSQERDDARHSALSEALVLDRAGGGR
jgi:hypothetical protein